MSPHFWPRRSENIQPAGKRDFWLKNNSALNFKIPSVLNGSGLVPYRPFMEMQSHCRAALLLGEKGLLPQLSKAKPNQKATTKTQEAQLSSNFR